MHDKENNNSKIKYNNTALDYPLVIKKVGKYIVIKCPDFNKEELVSLPANGKIDNNFVNSLAKAISKSWIKSHKQLKSIRNSRITEPVPSVEITTKVKKQKSIYFSASEAAEKLGVHRNTILNMVKQNKIPHTLTAGGHARFTEIDIEMFKKQN